MNDLKFNINGFTKPTNRAECIELLREMNRMADELQAQWDAIGEALTASDVRVHAEAI